MSKTIALARRLGLIEERHLLPSRRTNTNQDVAGLKLQQTFAYLIIIDFESTCWSKNEQHASNEIIEFPALLMDTSTGVILSQFHYYVQPVERPQLSLFCTRLTGITQAQVDDSCPLAIVLSKFQHWLNNVKAKYNFTFNTGEQRCAFVTWTNWDLGVCLQQECRRKDMALPEPLRSWVDLKAIYKKFYRRQPKGLRASMEDVGLQFKGREHSGICDSENTARLLYKMITDGCHVTLTKHHIQ